MNTLPASRYTGASHPRTSCSASLIRISSAVGLAAILLAALLLFSGCATTTPLDTAAKSLASTVATVDAAMTGYGNLVVLGQVSPQEQEHVRKLYAGYQAAENVAEAAITNAIKSSDSGSLAAATAALNAAAFPLLQFLTQFTNAPNP